MKKRRIYKKNKKIVVFFNYNIFAIRGIFNLITNFLYFENYIYKFDSYI